MKLTWTRAAAHDRREIRAYISQDNPPAALTLDKLIAEQAAHLTSHPELGRPGRIAGTRELVVHRNYILIYDLATDLVRVLRVLHTARQWPSQL